MAETQKVEYKLYVQQAGESPVEVLCITRPWLPPSEVLHIFRSGLFAFAAEHPESDRVLRILRHANYILSADGVVVCRDRMRLLATAMVPVTEFRRLDGDNPRARGKNG